MKAIVDFIDDFIENMFNGQIISVMSKDINMKGSDMPMSVIALGGSKKPELITNFVSEKLGDLLKLIPQCLDQTITNREEIASQLFEVILMLRIAGIIQNNPNNLKELEFYKDRCKIFENEIRERDEQISGYLATIKKLHAEVVGKSAIG